MTAASLIAMETFVDVAGKAFLAAHRRYRREEETVRRGKSRNLA